MNETDFLEHRNELICILKLFCEMVAIKGDKLGQTDVLQHKTVLEEGAKHFFIPNYRIPINIRATVNDIAEEMKADDTVEEMKADDVAEEMKADGVVVPSNSLHNSPLLLM